MRPTTLLLPLSLLLACAEGDDGGMDDSDAMDDTAGDDSDSGSGADDDTGNAGGDTADTDDTDAEADSPCLPPGAGTDDVVTLTLDASFIDNPDREANGVPVTEVYDFDARYVSASGSLPGTDDTAYVVVTIDPPLDLAADTTAAVQVGVPSDQVGADSLGAPGTLIVNGTTTTGGTARSFTPDTNGPPSDRFGLTFDLAAAASLECVGWTFTVTGDPSYAKVLSARVRIDASCDGDFSACPEPLLTAE